MITVNGLTLRNIEDSFTFVDNISFTINPKENLLLSVMKEQGNQTSRNTYLAFLLVKKVKSF